LWFLGQDPHDLPGLPQPYTESKAEIFTLIFENPAFYADAKNYLKEDEIDELNRIVVMWLDFAADQARRRKQVFIRDWEQRLDRLRQLRCQLNRLILQKS